MELSKTRIRKIRSWELKMDRIQVENSLNGPKHGSQKCISCDPISSDGLGEGVNMQTIYWQNLPVLRFTCGDV